MARQRSVKTIAKISKTVDGGNVVREFESLPLRCIVRKPGVCVTL